MADLEKEFEQEKDLEEEFEGFEAAEIPAPPEIGAAEAFTLGMGEGGTLGFAGELSGLLGAASEKLAELTGYEDVTEEDVRELLSPEALARAERAGIEVTPAKPISPELIDLYRQYRESAEARHKAAAEQRPITYTAGGVAGGMAIPATGIAKVAARAPSLAARVAGGAALGAGAGAIGGAGVSEADLTRGEIRPLAEDILTGAEIGAVTGGALPVLGTAAQKTLGAIRESKAMQNLLSSFRRGIKGERLIGEKGREEATEATVETIKDLFPTLKGLGRDLNAEIQSVLRRADEEGVTIELQQRLTDIRNRLTNMVETSRDPRVATDAQKLLDIIDNQMLGRKVAKLEPIETARQKAVERITKKRAKTTLAAEADIPEEISRQRLARKIAKREAEAPEGFISPTEEIVETEAGKRAIVAELGEGDRMAEIIDDPSLTPLEIVTDPESGLPFLQYMDKSTGKLMQEFLPPEEVTKYRRVIERVGGKTDISPTEARELRQTFQAYTPKGEMPLAGKVANEAIKTTQELGEAVEQVAPGFSKANRAYSNFKNALDILDIDVDVDVGEALGKLGKRLENIQKDTPSGFMHRKIMDEFIDELAQADYKVAKETKDALYDVAERMDLAFERMAPSVVAGKSGATLRTGISGLPIAVGNVGGRMIRDVFGPKLMDAIGKKLVLSKDKISQKLGVELTRGAKADEKTKQAILFGIMQNPVYRKILQREGVIAEEGENE